MIRCLVTLVLQAAIPALLAESGLLVEVEYGPTKVLLDRVRHGGEFDGMLLTRAGCEELAASGLCDPSSIFDIAVSRVGLALTDGASRPDISTPDALRDVLSAGPVAYSVAGPSGQAFAAAIERLGIAEAVNRTALILNTGLTGERLLSGEARVAIQQISELRMVPGIQVVGPLPTPFDASMTISGCAKPGANKDVHAFLRYLASAEAAAILARTGLERPD